MRVSWPADSFIWGYRQAVRQRTLTPLSVVRLHLPLPVIKSCSFPLQDFLRGNKSLSRPVAPAPLVAVATTFPPRWEACHTIRKEPQATENQVTRFPTGREGGGASHQRGNTFPTPAGRLYGFPSGKSPVVRFYHKRAPSINLEAPPQPSRRRRVKPKNPPAFEHPLSRPHISHISHIKSRHRNACFSLKERCFFY